jgi:hypothetical protein
VRQAPPLGAPVQRSLQIKDFEQSSRGVCNRNRRKESEGRGGEGGRGGNCLVTSAATTRIGSPEYEPLISVAAESPLVYATPDLDIRAPL